VCVRVCVCVCVCVCTGVCVCVLVGGTLIVKSFVESECATARIFSYGVASISRLLQIISLFCKRAF